jgi:hypothetical protein
MKEKMQRRKVRLFVDDQIIEELKDIRRIIGKPIKHRSGPVLKADKSWEEGTHIGWATVLWDNEESVFKAWYQTFRVPSPGEEESNICYAVSQDGIRWEKPDLHIMTHLCSTANNIIVKQIGPSLDAPSVIKDLKDPDPERRYKMLLRENNGHALGAAALFSPDGIHWQRHPQFPLIDTQDAIACTYDPLIGKFVAFTKNRVEGRRARFITTSEDFIHWPSHKVILVPDEKDPRDTEFYHNYGFLYEGHYIGLLDIYHTDPQTIDVQLIHSRDGLRWERCSCREPFISLGAPSSWDCGMVFCQNCGPIIRGDEIWLYYYGVNAPHDNHGGETISSLGLVTYRLDGFAAMEAGEKEGNIITKPFSFNKNTLEINADASKGSISVEILDENGKAIEGLDVENCHPMTEDALRFRVNWREEKALEALRGKKIRLCFRMRKAKLFSFSFCEVE